jgi:hypothetical protein
MHDSHEEHEASFQLKLKLFGGLDFGSMKFWPNSQRGTRPHKNLLLLDR